MICGIKKVYTKGNINVIFNRQVLYYIVQTVFSIFVINTRKPVLFYEYL